MKKQTADNALAPDSSTFGGSTEGSDHAEERISAFYNTVGWKTEEGITEDARRWEDLREYATEYVSKCRLRVLRHIPDHGVNILDMASGPIQFVEYLEYSKHFNKRYCVDLSAEALAEAKRKLGDHGVFLHGSFLSMPMQENFFDCAISLHTIYHIDKDKQEEAVRKLVNVTKPGRSVIIVYSNPNNIVHADPNNFVRCLKLPFRLLKRIKNVLKNPAKQKEQKEDFAFYFHPHPIEWWKRFGDVADAKILPWRSFDSPTQKKLIPNNRFGKKMFGILFYLEDRFPEFFVKYFQYPMVILTKKTN